LNEKNQSLMIVLIYTILVSIIVPFIPNITTTSPYLTGLLCGVGVIPILIFIWRRKKLSKEYERWTLTDPSKGKLEYMGLELICKICNNPLRNKVVVPFDITKPMSTNGDNVVHKSCKEIHFQEAVKG